MAALLGAIGIDAWPALANSSRKVDPDLPSPSEFDHLITVIPRGPDPTAWIWLDPTPAVAPYRMLLAPLRDRDVLVVRPAAAGAASIVRTPAAPPLDAHEIPRSRLPEYVAFVRAMRADNEQPIGITFDAATSEIPDDATAADVYAVGHAAYQREDYRMALRFFGKAVELDPKHTSGWNAIGLTHERLNDLPRAVGWREVASDLSGRSHPADAVPAVGVLPRRRQELLRPSAVRAGRRAPLREQ